MKRIFAFSVISFLFSIANTEAKNIGIGTADPHESAILDVVSEKHGVLLPRVVDTTVITNPAEGLIIYSTDNSVFFYYNGSKWVNIGNSDLDIDHLPENAILFKKGGLIDGLDNIVINNSGNVGIGTDSPSEKLHVAGKVKIEDIDGLDALRANDSILLAGTDGLVSKVGKSELGGKFVDGNKPEDAVYNVANGNVGIGTDEPRAKLEVSATDGAILRLSSGSTSGTEHLVLSNSNPRNPVGMMVGIFSLSQKEIPHSLEFFDFSINGGGIDILNIRASLNENIGKVGIGTDEPSESLDVDGKVRVRDIDGLDALRANDSILVAGTDGLVSKVGKSELGGKFVDGNKPEDAVYNVANGNVGIGTDSPSEKLHVAGKVKIEDIDGLDALRANDSILLAGTDGLVSKVGKSELGGKFVDGNKPEDAVYNVANGNVGVGTSDPAKALHIESDDQVGVLVSSAGATTTLAIRSGDESNDKSIRLSTQDNLLRIQVGNKDGNYDASFSNIAEFSQDGKLGIGTGGGADATLHIVDREGLGESIMLQREDNSNSLGISFRNSANNREWNIYQTGGDYGDFRIRGGYSPLVGLTDYFTIKNSGNVGIGTTNPSQKLDVIGNTYVSGNVGIGTTSPSQKLDVRGNTYVSGNVGIGTVNPSRRLHIESTDQVGALISSTGQNATLALRDQTNSKTMRIVANNTNGLVIQTGDASGELSTSGGDIGTIAVFKRNGLVGIGTTGPQLPLHVAKKIYSFNYATNSGTKWKQFRNGNTGFYDGSGSTPPHNLGNGISIYAAGGIIAGDWITSWNATITSDARIKNIEGVSNSKEDLSTIKKIEVVDYTMKDFVTWGGRKFKKVIAQDVEKVYPNAVNKMRGEIPSIYCLTESIVLDTGQQEMTLRLPKSHGLSDSSVVVLIDDTDTKHRFRLSGIIDSVSFKVDLGGQSWTQTDTIFVFGEEVEDLRTIDYDALSMLTLSAVQELAREKEEIETRLSASEAENKAMKDEIEQLKAQGMQQKEDLKAAIAQQQKEINALKSLLMQIAVAE